jgi:hypothetical protein
MKRKVRVTVLLFGIFVLIWPGTIVAQKKKSVNERILEILIEKNIITKDQYEDLLKQAKEEESRQAKAQKREDKEPKVTAGFKRGFYIETADKKSKISISSSLKRMPDSLSVILISL